MNLLGTAVAARALGIATDNVSVLPPREWMTLVLGGALGSLAGLALAIAWLRKAVRATWADMGWRAEGLRSNLLLGFGSFFVLMFPIYGLQYALNYFYERLFGPPGQHPMIQRLLDHPDATAFAISGFAAVIVAPLAEEFLFRAVFQAWLERLVVRWMPSPAPATRSEAIPGQEQVP